MYLFYEGQDEIINVDANSSIRKEDRRITFNQSNGDKIEWWFDTGEECDQAGLYIKNTIQ